MPMDIRLRSATRADVPTLLQLMQGLYALDHIDFAEDRARSALAGLLADPALGEVWMVESRSAGAESGEIVGYAVLTLGYSLEFGGRFWLLDELFVRKENRGRGAGSQILREIVQAARERGLQAVRLEVGQTNLRAQDLYRRAGFEVHDRHLMTRRIDRGEPGRPR